MPSKGHFYPSDNPLSSGQVEIKYMTAKEEDILTSANLIQKGIVLDKLLQALIVSEGVNLDDVLIGDKNAIMIASRILAYGKDYKFEYTDPSKEGIILFFPSELSHQVFPFYNCDEDRVSISGNLVLNSKKYQSV